MLAIGSLLRLRSVVYANGRLLEDVEIAIRLAGSFRKSNSAVATDRRVALAV
jgi:hypothetical protein